MKKFSYILFTLLIIVSLINETLLSMAEGRVEHSLIERGQEQIRRDFELQNKERERQQELNQQRINLQKLNEEIQRRKTAVEQATAEKKIEAQRALEESQNELKEAQKQIRSLSTERMQALEKEIQLKQEEFENAKESSDKTKILGELGKIQIEADLSKTKFELENMKDDLETQNSSKQSELKKLEDESKQIKDIMSELKKVKSENLPFKNRERIKELNKQLEELTQITKPAELDTYVKNLETYIKKLTSDISVIKSQLSFVDSLKEDAETFLNSKATEANEKLEKADLSKNDKQIALDSFKEATLSIESRIDFLKRFNVELVEADKDMLDDLSKSIMKINKNADEKLQPMEEEIRQKTEALNRKSKELEDKRAEMDNMPSLLLTEVPEIKIDQLEKSIVNAEAEAEKLSLNVEIAQTNAKAVRVNRELEKIKAEKILIEEKIKTTDEDRVKKSLEKIRTSLDQEIKYLEKAIKEVEKDLKSLEIKAKVTEEMSKEIKSDVEKSVGLNSREMEELFDIRSRTKSATEKETEKQEAIFIARSADCEKAIKDISTRWEQIKAENQKLTRAEQFFILATEFDLPKLMEDLKIPKLAYLNLENVKTQNILQKRSELLDFLNETLRKIQSEDFKADKAGLDSKINEINYLSFRLSKEIDEFKKREISKKLDQAQVDLRAYLLTMEAISRIRSALAIEQKKVGRYIKIISELQRFRFSTVQLSFTEDDFKKENIKSTVFKKLLLDAQKIEQIDPNIDVLNIPNLDVYVKEYEALDRIISELKNKNFVEEDLRAISITDQEIDDMKRKLKEEKEVNLQKELDSTAFTDEEKEQKKLKMNTLPEKYEEILKKKLAALDELKKNKAPENIRGVIKNLIENLREKSQVQLDLLKKERGLKKFESFGEKTNIFYTGLLERIKKVADITFNRDMKAQKELLLAVTEGNMLKPTKEQAKKIIKQLGDDLDEYDLFLEFAIMALNKLDPKLHKDMIIGLEKILKNSLNTMQKISEIIGQKFVNPSNLISYVKNNFDKWNNKDKFFDTNDMEFITNWTEEELVYIRNFVNRLYKVGRDSANILYAIDKSIMPTGGKVLYYGIAAPFKLLSQFFGRLSQGAAILDSHGETLIEKSGIEKIPGIGAAINLLRKGVSMVTKTGFAILGAFFEGICELALRLGKKVSE